jgi:hypothetical protein
MRRYWLNTRFGINFVAVGLVAVWVAAAVIVVQDVWFLSTGTWPKLPLHREVLYELLAAVAAAFSITSFFVLRPGLPKIAAVVLTISYASYVIQSFAPIHGHDHLVVLCVSRMFGFCTLLLLIRRYFLDLKAERITR